jgi:hypothetical protein
MGKHLLLEAQTHIDNALDTYLKHYADRSSIEDPELAKELCAPEAVDNAMNGLAFENASTHKFHNDGDYDGALGALGRVHGFLDRAAKALPKNDTDRAYPVYQAVRHAKTKVDEIGEKYSDLMTSEPPKE